MSEVLATPQPRRNIQKGKVDKAGYPERSMRFSRASHKPIYPIRALWSAGITLPNTKHILSMTHLLARPSILVRPLSHATKDNISTGRYKFVNARGRVPAINLDDGTNESCERRGEASAGAGGEMSDCCFTTVTHNPFTFRAHYSPPNSMQIVQRSDAKTFRTTSVEEEASSTAVAAAVPDSLGALPLGLTSAQEQAKPVDSGSKGVQRPKLREQGVQSDIQGVRGAQVVLGGVQRVEVGVQSEESVHIAGSDVYEAERAVLRATPCQHVVRIVRARNKVVDSGALASNYGRIVRDLNDLGQLGLGIVASRRSPFVDSIRGSAPPGSQVPGSNACGFQVRQPAEQRELAAARHAKSSSERVQPSLTVVCAHGSDQNQVGATGAGQGQMSCVEAVGVEVNDGCVPMDVDDNDDCMDVDDDTVYMDTD
ncbi:hypothetical protein BC629DRAFT_1591531 [Irpex lacteus]|nr:hypothetical protein BC629DRAFT_1591531 [Irpex lacteus]